MSDRDPFPGLQEAFVDFHGLVSFFLDIDAQGREWAIGETYAGQLWRVWDFYCRHGEGDWRFAAKWLTLRPEPFRVGDSVGPTAHHVLFGMMEEFLWCAWRDFLTPEQVLAFRTPTDFSLPDDDVFVQAQRAPITRRLGATGLQTADLDFVWSAILQEQTRLEAADATAPPQTVTLLQMAAIVNRSKRTLEDYKADMPLPVVEGGGGNPAEWAWDEVRPWLEKKFKRPLPAIFPAERFIRQ